MSEYAGYINNVWFFNELIINSFIHFTYSDNLNVNIARGKPTALSSTYGVDKAYSSFAVDGNTSGDMEISGCAHSGADWRNQWWMVDLQMTYLIHRVIITNRNKLGK